MLDVVPTRRWRMEEGQAVVWWWLDTGKLVIRRMLTLARAAAVQLERMERDPPCLHLLMLVHLLHACFALPALQGCKLLEEGSPPLGYMGPVHDPTPKSGRPGSNICAALTGAGMGTYGTRRMFFFWGKLRGGVRARLFLCLSCGDWNSRRLFCSAFSPW